MRDEKYIGEWIERVEKRNVSQILRKLAKSLEVHGLDNLQELRGKHFTGFANHESHLDYIALGYLFLKHLGAEDFPGFIAGENLDRPWIYRLSGANFRKMGALFVDRKKMKEAKRAYVQESYKKLEEAVSSGNILVFPEGGRRYFGSPMENMNGNGIVNLLARNNSDNLIVPISIRHDAAPEKPYFKLLEWTKKKATGLYYGVDAFAIFKYLLFNPEYGRITVGFGKPTKLEDIGGTGLGDRKDRIRRFVKEKVLELYHNN